MVEYLYRALSNSEYADWSELDVITAAKPDTTTYGETQSVYFPTAAEYFITDGQHRYCALMDFVRRHPEYADKFTQAAAISVLPQDRLSEWAGQSFHDKNYLRTAVKMTKALAVDHRDPHNILAKKLAGHPVVLEGGGANEVKDALAATAREFATHAALYRLTRAFCEGRRGLEKAPIKNPRLIDDNMEQSQGQLFEYLNELNHVLPHWTVTPGREAYLFRSSPALQALGVLGYELYTKVDDPETRRSMVAEIGEGKLDWRRTNVVEWDGIIGEATIDRAGVSPRANRQSIDATIRFLRDRSGMSRHLDQIGADGAASRGSA